MKLSEIKAFQLMVLNELTAAEKVCKADPEASWHELRDAVTNKYGMGDVYSFVEMG